MTRSNLYAAALTRALDFVTSHPDVEPVGIKVEPRYGLPGQTGTVVIIHLTAPDFEAITKGLYPRTFKHKDSLHLSVDHAEGVVLITVHMADVTSEVAR